MVRRDDTRLLIIWRGDENTPPSFGKPIFRGNVSLFACFNSKEARYLRP